jgi:alkylation response protein AidB-like acyl-CoA dehydrogenase
LDFNFTDDQRMVREMVAEFADQVLGPEVMKRDREGLFPAAEIAQAGELGLLGMSVPEEWGGSGLDSVSTALALMELARVCPSTAVTISVTNSVCAYPIWRSGTDEQRERYLKPLASGKMIGGFCLTEPQAGSDATNQKTRAARQGDRYVLNGTKVWVTNAHVGEVFVVMAVTDPEKGKKGISAFIVTPDMPGFSFTPKEEKMGLRASTTASIVLDDCEVPAGNLLGQEGDGMKIPLNALDGGRIGIAAQSVGIARGARDEAVRYAKERVAFGRPIAGFQAIQFQIADMETEMEAAWLLTLRAASLRDRDPDRIGIHGGYGYSRDYPVERFFRDARVTTLYEGTSEIQRIVISRAILAD